MKGKDIRRKRQKESYRKVHPTPEKRDCAVCNKTTYWKYDPVIGHGTCTMCGAKFKKKKK